MQVCQEIVSYSKENDDTTGELVQCLDMVFYLIICITNDDGRKALTILKERIYQNKNSVSFLYRQN